MLIFLGLGLQPADFAGVTDVTLQTSGLRRACGPVCSHLSGAVIDASRGPSLGSGNVRQRIRLLAPVVTAPLWTCLFEDPPTEAGPTTLIQTRKGSASVCIHPALMPRGPEGNFDLSRAVAAYHLSMKIGDDHATSPSLLSSSSL